MSGTDAATKQDIQDLDHKIDSQVKRLDKKIDLVESNLSGEIRILSARVDCLEETVEEMRSEMHAGFRDLREMIESIIAAQEKYFQESTILQKDVRVMKSAFRNELSIDIDSYKSR